MGLHCAEEVAVLRRVLDRHAGVTAVHIDQVRAEVSFGLAPPATLASAATAVSRAGLRLVHASDVALGDGVDPRIWWAGLASGTYLLLALAVQLLVSGGDWRSLVVDVDDVPMPTPVLVSYLFAAGAAGIAIVPRAVGSIRHGHLDMNVLVVVAALGATWLGALSEAAMVMGLFAGSQLLESWSAARARRAIGALMQGTPAHTACRVNGRERRVAIADVTPGMLLLIRPGERIPVDGEIVEGSSSGAIALFSVRSPVQTTGGPVKTVRRVS